MILSLQRRIHDAIAGAVRDHFGISDVPAFTVEVPPNRALGDLAVPVAFQLARTVRKAPRAIAQELAGAIGAIPGVARIVAAPNGYLNLYLDRRSFLLSRVRNEIAPDRPPAEKTIVEHTAINPNKAAHVGHLRNAALGDTLVRVLRFRDTPVEVQNYIDDTGVQVADVIVGFRELEHRSFDEIRHLADTTRFDYYCWDLYSRVTEWYETDRRRLDIRAAALHDLEHGGNETAAIGAFLVDRIVRAHLETMGRLNIAYDLLTHEGDILRLQFWARAFEILKASGQVFLQTEGKLAGCWVMRIDEGSAKASAEREEQGSAKASAERGEQRSAASAERDEQASAKALAERDEAADEPEESREKVIVRSNGVVTYIGKDLANQFWKLGLLGRDFEYRRYLTQWNGCELWTTTSDDGQPAPSFGHAKRIYNVIDSRQMYLQALLSQALRTLGHPVEAENSIHFSYEMVALSHATARALGYNIAADGEEARKPFVEVSGRKGLGVKIDDLLDLLTDKATDEVGKRNPELPADERRRVGRQIAVAAIRYFMLKFSRGKLIVFDMEEALSFEGETGPYLQYAVVRANNIFNKLREREGVTDADVIGALDGTPADEILGQGEAGAPGDGAHNLWSVVFEAARLDDVVEQTVRALEFSILAKYVFGLAQLFNAFYHRYPILNEESVDRKRWRAAGVAYVRAQLTRALDLMGIEVPARM
jgi:arginyl-tRNA synthetase